MGKMFRTVDATWNPFTGCVFQCLYCWARKLAEGKLKYTDRYRDGFYPTFHPKELRKRFQAGQFVGISLMGDISFAPRAVIIDILKVIREQPDVKFLFCSKNPACYILWGLGYPSNLYLGATIETDRDYGLSKAPPPEERFMAMEVLKHAYKFISMEPIMDFHLRTMVDWMRAIGPEIIEVGPDNYNNRLVEPQGMTSGARAPWKVRWLLEELREFCPNVIEKKGLERLKGEGSYGTEERICQEG